MPRRATGFEQRPRPLDVVTEGVHRIGDRRADQCLGGKMDDRVRARVAEDHLQLGGVADVAVDELVARVGVVWVNGRAVAPQVIDADDFVIRGEQLGDQVSSDEARGAGDQDPHRSPPPPPPPP